MERRPVANEKYLRACGLTLASMALAGCASESSPTINSDASNEPRLECVSVSVDIARETISVDLRELNKPANTPPHAQAVIDFVRPIAAQSTPLDKNGSGDLGLYPTRTTPPDVRSVTVINRGADESEFALQCETISFISRQQPLHEKQRDLPSTGS